MNDLVLITWIVVSFFWSCIVLGATTYLVFWRGESVWWYVLGLLICDSPSLFKALRKRFEVDE